MVEDRQSSTIDADWVTWWKPSEAQVQWQAALVDYRRKQLVQQALSGGYGRLTSCLVPPDYEFDVDILDPEPTAVEVEAMRNAAAGPVEPLPIAVRDWSVFEDEDDEDDLKFLGWLDARFPRGWDWVRWLDPTSSSGKKFFAELGKECPEVVEFFLYVDDDDE